MLMEDRSTKQKVTGIFFFFFFFANTRDETFSKEEIQRQLFKKKEYCVKL